MIADLLIAVGEACIDVPDLDTLRHHLLHLALAEWEAVGEPRAMTDDLYRVAKPSVRRQLDTHQAQSLLTPDQPGDPPSHGAGD